MNATLRDLVYGHDEIADLDPAERRLALRRILADAEVPDLATVVEAVADEIDGLGPLTRLLEDESVTDVLVNGPHVVQVERDGKLQETPVSFEGREELLVWCERIVASCGGRVDAAHPIADVTLRDGARLHVVLPPIAPDGPLVSIRRPATNPLSLDELVTLELLDQSAASSLKEHVQAGASIVISGATGTGKTTLLDALLQLIPMTERTISIEELGELRSGENRIALIAREPNAEGRGRVTLEELVRASLRMRPDRIVVGEVRGAEALPALWAMSTGHRGGMLTVHARSACDARRRLVNLALSSPHAPSEAALLAQVDEAIDIWVHIEKNEGRRTVAELVER